MLDPDSGEIIAEFAIELGARLGGYDYTAPTSSTPTTPVPLGGKALEKAVYSAKVTYGLAGSSWQLRQPATSRTAELSRHMHDQYYAR